jgi:hypothetical protein
MRVLTPTRKPSRPSVSEICQRISNRIPWEERYTDEFYEDILNAGFNSATIEQAFVLAQIVESIGPITLRGAFYRAVSAGIFPDTAEAHYRTAGNIVLKLRRSGCISYSKIVDATRRRLKPGSWSGVGDFLDAVAVSYRLDLWSRQKNYIEFFVEKDAMAGIIEPVTREYDVALNIIRGDISETFVYNIADEWKQIRKPIYSYYLGDHDPSGLRIEKTLVRKLCDYTNQREDFFWCRLAIDKEDFSDPDILGFPIKGDRNSKAWQTKHRDYLAAHGDRCVEVDALAPDEIRRRVREIIESHIDQDEWSRLKLIEEQERETVQQFVLAQKGAAA